MKMQDFMLTLRLGVLRNTKHGGDQENGESGVELVPLMQEGLMQLHSRFVIKEKNVIVEMRVGTTFYHLKKMYSVTGADPVQVPYPYIMDLPGEPFEEDVIKVLRVDDSNGVIRPIGDPNQMNSVFMPQPDILQNPYPKELEALILTYQAGPSSLMTVNGDGNPEIAEEFYIPPVLVPALTNYVAYMFYSALNTAEAMAKSVQHLQMYDSICDGVDAMDLLNNSKYCTNERFSKNGWQ